MLTDTSLDPDDKKLRIAIDAFLSDATLLPDFEFAPEAWKQFVLEFIWTFDKVLEIYDEEEE